MARPKKPEVMRTLSLRLPDKLIQAVDACAEELQAEMPLFEITRTDALRYLLQLGLTRHGRKRGQT
jgi:hypothetical protein